MDSSKVVKAVLLITVAVLFLVTSIMSLTSASRIGAETVKTYVLEVETCEYKYLARPIEPEAKPLPEEETCKIDYNQAKERIVDSIALFIVSLPVAIFTYRKLFKIYKE
jgi:hypothetical protein